MGILKGIYKFEKESKNEFKDWVTYAPGDNFCRVFDKWKGLCKNPNNIKVMNYYIMESNVFYNWENHKIFIICSISYW